MNKKLILLKTLFVFSLSLTGQIINTDISNYKSFDNGTTYFVKTTNNDIDSYIETILENFWTINNYEIITESEVSQTSNENSFYVNFFTYSFTKDAGSTGALNMEYEVTKLLLFKALTEPKKDIRKPIGTLSSIELDEITPSELLYSIQLLQNQIKFVKELNIKKRLDFKDFLKKVNKKKKTLIKEKTLFLKQSQLSSRVYDSDKVKKFYEYKFEIKSEEEIEKAILNQDSNVIYAKFIRLRTLHFLIIINAANSEILYGKVSTGFSQNTIGPRFLKDMSK